MVLHNKTICAKQISTLDLAVLSKPSNIPSFVNCLCYSQGAMGVTEEHEMDFIYKMRSTCTNYNEEERVDIFSLPQKKQAV